MKRVLKWLDRIWTIVVVAIIVYVLSVRFCKFVWQSQHSEPMSELVLANVEALAGGENGKYDYDDGLAIVSECGVSLGTEDFWGNVEKCTVTVIFCQGGGSGCNEEDCPTHRNS